MLDRRAVARTVAAVGEGGVRSDCWGKRRGKLGIRQCSRRAAVGADEKAARPWDGKQRRGSEARAEAVRRRTKARQRGRQAAVDAGAEAANGGWRDGEQRPVGAGVLWAEAARSNRPAWAARAGELRAGELAE